MYFVFRIMDPDIMIEEQGQMTTTSPYSLSPTNHSWHNSTENGLNVYYFYDVSGILLFTYVCQ